jgi:hypothetical protein
MKSSFFGLTIQMRDVPAWCRVFFCLESAQSSENILSPRLSMADPKEEQLSKLRMVLAVAEKNGNQLFIDNIKRDIEALERGEDSPIIAEYLTEEERR